MTAPARLSPNAHPWMRATATAAVIDALSPAGGDTARFVGGCVRNALLGVPVEDVDIATTLTPDEAGSVLKRAGVKVVPTGIDHGTLTAIVDGKPFEVTTLRRDVETFGRRAAVAFTTDWLEDAKRRDFRFNAIYARPDGVLFDPFDGLSDIASRRVVFIGKAEDRIAEDVLRILRFYRFNAWYGSEIDAAGQAACAALADQISGLSVERVWKELKKLLAAADPGPVVRAMQEGHVLSQVLPGDIDFNLFLSIIEADRGKSRAPDPLLRIAALLGRDGVAMQRVVEHMKASNAERARIQAMGASASDFGVPALEPGLSERARSFALYQMGAAAFADQMRLREAAGGGDATADLAAARDWSKPKFPLTGKDLIAAGITRGPELGARLAQLERTWAESGFEMSRAALLARVRGGAT